MGEKSTPTGTNDTALFAGEGWFDPNEVGIRNRVRGFIQELLEQELTAALGRSRYERVVGDPKGYRNGSRERQLLGSFGPTEISVPRARMARADGSTREWSSPSLPRYVRMTRQVEALIAGAYLAGANTRRVKRVSGCTIFPDSSSWAKFTALNCERARFLIPQLLALPQSL